MYHRQSHTGAALALGIAAGIALGTTGAIVVQRNPKVKRGAHKAARVVSDIVGNMQQMVK